LQHDARQIPLILIADDDAGIQSGGNDACELLGTRVPDSCSVNAGNGNVSMWGVDVVLIEEKNLATWPQKVIWINYYE
jgi:hypothetical protein